jgi:uncharacterized repeat protein (TIGR02543 family)
MDYNFEGWNTAPDGSGSPFTASTTVNGDMTVYAQWIAPPPPSSFTVTFKLNDGTETNWTTRTVTFPVDTIAGENFPDNPSRTGYSFEGWNTAPDGLGSPFTVLTTVSVNITVYAQWTAETYTVTFKSNDGTDTTLHTKTVTVPATTIGAANFPANPTRAEYNFTGWNTASAGSGSPFTASTTVSADITVYARWTAVSPGFYTVVFKLNDGTEATWAAKIVTPPVDTIIVGNFPGAPSRKGYTFTGWNTAVNGSGTSFTTSTIVNIDIIVYAQWTGKTYTVTFKSNDGTDTTLHTKAVTVPATTIDAGNFPSDPTRTGYTFADWNIAPNGSGTVFTASTEVSADITVYARWDTYSYTVIFNNNDGDTAANPATKTVASPATSIDTLPISPTRAGYDFGGWNTQANGSGSPFSASTTVNADITVYAQWTGETYTVTFKSNDGTDTTLHTKTVTVPVTTIGAANFPADPARTGYNFEGWNTAVGGSGSLFSASTTVSGDITVYAQWTGKTYTVLFKHNDGTDTTLHTKTVTVPATTIGAANFPANPTRTEYAFTGWNTAPAGSGSGFTATTTISGNMTVYAQWAAIYTVTFKYNDGTDTTLHTKTVTMPATTIGAVNFPASPTLTGYSFGGWYAESNGGGSAFTASSIVSENMTVYARWDSYSYTVTFNNSGGDTAASPVSKTVTSPETTIDALPTPPTRTGYFFGGWYTGGNGTGSVFTALTTITGDITVYARWTTGGFITLNPDAGDGAFGETDFTLSKSGPGNPTSQIISITGTGYTNPRWFIDGDLKGMETNITIDAADYAAGGHTLSLIINKSGIFWSKEISFTVVN